MSRQRKAKKEHFPIGNAKNATFTKKKGVAKWKGAVVEAAVKARLLLLLVPFLG